MDTIILLFCILALSALAWLFLPKKRRSAQATEPQPPAKRIIRLDPDDALDTFFCAVVGESFRNDDGSSRQEIIRAHARPGVQAHLERDTENEFDSNAIAVYVNDQQIGYLKAEVAARHAAKLDTGRYALYAVVATVNGGTPSKPSFGVTLEATLFKVQPQ